MNTNNCGSWNFLLVTYALLSPHTQSWKIQLNLVQGCGICPTSHLSPHAGHVIELSWAHVSCRRHGEPRSRSHPAALRQVGRRLMKTSNNSLWIQMNRKLPGRSWLPQDRPKNDPNTPIWYSSKQKQRICRGQTVHHFIFFLTAHRFCRAFEDKASLYPMGK